MVTRYVFVVVFCLFLTPLNCLASEFAVDGTITRLYTYAKERPWNPNYSTFSLVEIQNQTVSGSKLDCHPNLFVIVKSDKALYATMLTARSGNRAVKLHVDNTLSPMENANFCRIVGASF